MGVGGPECRYWGWRPPTVCCSVQVERFHTRILPLYGRTGGVACSVAELKQCGSERVESRI
jgi:hypothetical protein